MEINLSEILDDACSISLTIAGMTMFCTELQPIDGQEKDYLEKYLPEYADILIKYFDDKEHYEFSSNSLIEKRENNEKIIKNELEKIRQLGNSVYDFYDDDILTDCYELEEKLEFRNLFNSSIYNLAFLLLTIDRCENYDKDILYCNSLNEYDRGMSLLIDKMSMLCTIHLGISNFIIERDQRNNAFKWGKHYNVAPNMQYTIRNQQKYQAVKEICFSDGLLTPTEGKCFISDVLLLIDLFRVKQQCSLERLMVVLIFISESYEYPKWMNQYAEIFVDILNEILFCGEIFRVYFQEGYYNSYSSQEKTSNDATTRLSIIFSACNDDIYIIRVDLPHKGENSFHINMEEVVGDKILPTGYPLDFHDSVHLRKLLGDSFEELFFEMNDKYWFRSQFDVLLKRTELSDEQRKEVNDIFHAQAHLKISYPLWGETDCECKEQILFINEIKKYVSRLKMKESDFLVFKKGDIEYCSEILKIRSLFFIEQNILKKILKTRKDELVSCNIVFRYFMKLQKREYKDDNDFTLIELWEKIENELLTGVE